VSLRKDTTDPTAIKRIDALNGFESVVRNTGIKESNETGNLSVFSSVNFLISMGVNLVPKGCYRLMFDGYPIEVKGTVKMCAARLGG
jgi:hypothetical protein